MYAQILLHRDTETWAEALNTLCLGVRRGEIFSNTIKCYTIKKRKFNWQRVNAFLGDEIEDIIEKAFEVLDRKV